MYYNTLLYNDCFFPLIASSITVLHVLSGMGTVANEYKTSTLSIPTNIKGKTKATVW